MQKKWNSALGRPELLKEKPLTQRQKDELNMVARYLAETWRTKYDIANILGSKDERKARDYVSKIAKKVPVISTSDSKGYKRATSPKDIDMAVKSRNELRSRIAELREREQVLTKWINAMAQEEMFSQGDLTNG